MKIEDRKYLLELIEDDMSFYKTLEGYRAIPLQEYTPKSEYGYHVLKIARGLAYRGMIFAVCMGIDGFFRDLIKSSLGKDEYVKRSISEKFFFIQSEPGSVGEYFSFTADATMLDNSSGGIKTEDGAMYMCARLDPKKFDVQICKLAKRDLEHMRENRTGILITYLPNPRWSLLGMVQKKTMDKVPLGDYMLADSKKVSEWSCLAGSSVIKRGFSCPVCFDIETIKFINNPH